MTVATTPLQVYLTVKDGPAAIDFYTRAFGASEEMKQMAEDGTRLMHATLSLFGYHMMLADEFPEMDPDTRAPGADKTTVTIHVNLADETTLDTVLAQAKDAGATITMPAQNMPWGAYYGRLVDPFGHSWSFASGH